MRGGVVLDGLGQQDKPRAGREHRHTPRDALAQRLEHPQLVEQLGLHGALAAGQHQAVEGLRKVVRLAQLDAAAPQLLEPALVLDKGPLHRKDGRGLSCAHRTTSPARP